MTEKIQRPDGVEEEIKVGSVVRYRVYNTRYTKEGTIKKLLKGTALIEGDMVPLSMITQKVR